MQTATKILCSSNPTATPIATEIATVPQLGNTEGDPADRIERLKELVSNRGIHLEYSEQSIQRRGNAHLEKSSFRLDSQPPKSLRP
jgi:hypothetical protein